MSVLSILLNRLYKTIQVFYFLLLINLIPVFIIQCVYPTLNTITSFCFSSSITQNIQFNYPKKGARREHNLKSPAGKCFALAAAPFFSFFFHPGSLSIDCLSQLQISDLKPIKIKVITIWKTWGLRARVKSKEAINLRGKKNLLTDFCNSKQKDKGKQPKEAPRFSGVLSLLHLHSASQRGLKGLTAECLPFYFGFTPPVSGFRPCGRRYNHRQTFELLPHSHELIQVYRLGVSTFSVCSVSLQLHWFLVKGEALLPWTSLWLTHGVTCFPRRDQPDSGTCTADLINDQNVQLVLPAVKSNDDIMVQPW